jgi:hypothetical protein
MRRDTRRGGGPNATSFISSASLAATTIPQQPPCSSSYPRTLQRLLRCGNSVRRIHAVTERRLRPRSTTRFSRRSFITARTALGVPPHWQTLPHSSRTLSAHLASGHRRLFPLSLRNLVDDHRCLSRAPSHALILGVSPHALRNSHAIIADRVSRRVQPLVARILPRALGIAVHLGDCRRLSRALSAALPFDNRRRISRGFYCASLSRRMSPHFLALCYAPFPAIIAGFLAPSIALLRLLRRLHRAAISARVLFGYEHRTRRYVSAAPSVTIAARIGYDLPLSSRIPLRASFFFAFLQRAVFGVHCRFPRAHR